MEYTKPELFVLSFASNAVRTSDTSGNDKATTTTETASKGDHGQTGDTDPTSSSSGAYQLDE